MPETNVDVIRAVYEEFNTTLALPRTLLRPDVAWHPPEDEPDNAPRFGVEAVTAYVSSWASSFDGYHVTVEELFEQNDRVIAVAVLHGRIGGGSTELRQPLVQVWTVEDGLITNVNEFRTRAEALRSL